MKKTLLFIASVALMAACTNDVVEQGNFVKPGEVAFSASTKTRTSMSPNAAGGLDIAWVGGEDQIGIFANDEGSLVYSNVGYTANESGSYSTFAANTNSIQWGTGAHNFYAYYPYTDAADLHQSAVPASIPAVQEQAADGDLEHLQPLAFMYSAQEGAVQSAGGIDFSFVNAFSVLEVKLCSAVSNMTCDAVIFRAVDEDEIVSASNIYVKLANGSLDYSSAEATNEIRVNMATPVELSTETPVSIYAMITPGHAGEQFQAIAVVGGEEVVLGEMGVPESGLPAGKKAVLELNVPAPVYETVDLNADGKTANTYIVPAVGTYSFKATVKGNGYTGAIQSGRYGNAAEVHTFVTGAAGTNQTSVDLAPASAEVLWFQAWCPDIKVYEKTCPILPESVVLTEEGNVEFTTTPNFIPGNAVIAVKDASGAIIWSWHIWLSEGYDPAVAGINVGTNNIVMMDRNIGANISNETGVADGWEAAQAVGMMYQHGRKDPFPGPFDIAKDCGDGNRGGVGYGAMTPDGVLMYGSNGQGGQNEDGGYTYIAATNYLHGLVADAGLSGNWTYADAVAYANANPHRLIHNRDRSGNSNPYDWWGTRNEEAVKQMFYYWGGPQVWPNCADITKTIYDPCPAGWVVPGVDFSATISKDATVTSVNYGWNVVLPSGQTAYFPHTGVRWGDATQLQKCNTLGAYWVNAIGDNACGAMNFVDNADGFVGVSSINGSAQEYEGMNCLSMGIQTRAIRCVKENAATVEPEPEPEDPAVDLSANGTSNCYIVNAATTEYKFKATVKGNGTTALTSDVAEIAPVDAYLLWAHDQATSDLENPGGYPKYYGASNAGNLIDVTSVELKDGYIRFKTGEEMPNGNAVICATDADGNIVWSWHLWIVKDYDAASTDYYVTTKGINAYMMDRNLGATCNPLLVAEPNLNDYIAARGLCYQWGRKDPFTSNHKYNGYAIQGLLFDAEGNSTAKYLTYGDERLFQPIYCDNREDGAGIYNDINKIVAWTASHPINYMRAGSETSYAWISTDSDGATEEWGKLWGNQGWTGSWDKGGVKTMYDPCPVGYRVPSTGHFIFITAHGDQASTGHGNNFRNWQFNSKEIIFDEAGAVIGGHEKEAPYGLHFYINGAKTKSEGAQDGVQDYGVTPEGLQTMYIPCQGLITYSGSPYDDNMYLQTNAPATGQTRWMKTEKGNFYYNATFGSYDQQAKAMPVRCVRE